MVRRWTHGTICEAVSRRLLEAGRYTQLYRNYEYSRNGFDGEMDVLGRSRRGWWHYYEVKSNDNASAYDRALRQFARARLAFPHFRWRFVYVTPQRVVEVRL